MTFRTTYNPYTGETSWSIGTLQERVGVADERSDPLGLGEAQRVEQMLGGAQSMRLAGGVVVERTATGGYSMRTGSFADILAQSAGKPSQGGDR